MRIHFAHATLGRREARVVLDGLVVLDPRSAPIALLGIAFAKAPVCFHEVRLARNHQTILVDRQVVSTAPLVAQAGLIVRHVEVRIVPGAVPELPRRIVVAVIVEQRHAQEERAPPEARRHHGSVVEGIGIDVVALNRVHVPQSHVVVRIVTMRPPELMHSAGSTHAVRLEKSRLAIAVRVDQSDRHDGVGAEHQRRPEAHGVIAIGRAIRAIVRRVGLGLNVVDHYLRHRLLSRGVSHQRVIGVVTDGNVVSLVIALGFGKFHIQLALAYGRRGVRRSDVGHRRLLRALLGRLGIPAGRLGLGCSFFAAGDNQHRGHACY